MAMPIKTPRVIFFDLDETLIVNSVSPEQWIGTVFSTYLSHLDAQHQPRFMRALFDVANGMWERMLEPGNDGRALMVDAFRHAAEQVGGDGRHAEAMFQLFVRTSSGGTLLSTEAHEVLDALRDMGIATGIITNGIEALQRTKIELHGLHDKVNAIVISEMAGAHKPDRPVFDYALKLAAVDAVDAWHVGDHLVNDIAGAIGAGMTAIHYNPSRETGADANRSADPHHVIHALSDLLPLLQRR
jgi:putative hydrolase of the HAD superfamily